MERLDGILRHGVMPHLSPARPTAPQPVWAFSHGDRFVLLDTYVKSAKVAFEIDGSSHLSQIGYD